MHLKRKLQNANKVALHLMFYDAHVINMMSC